MSAAVATTPLRWWSQAWRFGLVLAVSAVSVGAVVEASPEYEHNVHGLAPLDLGLGLAAVGALAFRRRWPFAIALGITAATAVSVSASGPWTLAVASLATHRRWWQMASVSAATLLAEWALNSLYPNPDESRWLTQTMALLVTVVLLAVGAYTGARRELVATLRERAETAEREQAARVEQARTAERAAIAREMHDVLAHRISLVAMHAGALAYREDLTQEETRAAAETIQATAHSALTDLRGVLGVLRSGAALDAAGMPERPQPTLTDLGDLVREVQAAGGRVDVHDLLPAGAQPPQAIARHAFRILQEACTNARKHAPGEPISIVLGGRPREELLLEVSNPLPPHDVPAAPGAGLGLIGLTERATLVGGRLEAARTRDDRFRVRAWLPWPTEEDR